MKYLLVVSILMMTIHGVQSQERWQQRAEYKMSIDFDEKNHQFTGEQKLKYFNNSPDTLTRVFYHLYFNAFQPGSMMDIRSRTISDPDRRVADRIFKLSPNEIGYQKINVLKQDGTDLKYEVAGTILEVELAKPLLPGKKTEFTMEFEAQVPIQIRRSGRDNAEGISYSMTQWYPKLCEYDYQGWHANPYIGREFHGVWASFDVHIKMHKDYMMCATGTLQNANKIKYGYQEDKDDSKKPGGLFKKKVDWHWKADLVHDFAWAADPHYTHITAKTRAGTTLHYLFQDGEQTGENWRKLHQAMDEAQQFLNANYGIYPYDSYAFVQGGDGGMEYPMMTLITGHRSYESLVGVSIHEWVHSWYQMALGTNESLYSWMDEGFTSFASQETTNHLRAKGLLEGEVQANPLSNSIRSYVRFSQSGMEEPLSTHADHFHTNAAYGVGSYTKGSVFLKQIEYIIGRADFKKGMLRYFDEWKFKHPNPNDFIRIMEKVSGLELDWFKEYFVYTTKTIDYAIKNVVSEGQGTKLTLERGGLMPMPLDILVTFKDGTSALYNIPLQIMRGNKDNEKLSGEYIVSQDWQWTHPRYDLTIDKDISMIKNIVIDHTARLADMDLNNNIWPEPKEEEQEDKPDEK